MMRLIKHRLYREILLLLLVMPMAVVAATSAPPRPFIPDSYAAILQTHQGHALLLVLWSLDCSPCHSELKMLGRIMQQDNALPVVLISTDGKSYSEEISSLLARYGLASADSWVYATDFPEQLQFEVDRHWYGELPRSYLFDQAHKRQAVSGGLDEQKLLLWMDEVRGVHEK
jgi:thiol-disulfide isomerase/thioredoxin